MIRQNNLQGKNTDGSLSSAGLTLLNLLRSNGVTAQGDKEIRPSRLLLLSCFDGSSPTGKRNEIQALSMNLT